MSYIETGSLILSILILLIVVLLCLKDKKREISASENEEEIQDEIVEEMDPRESFHYIIGCYFDMDYKESFFKIYEKLLDKASDISRDSRCDSDDFEKFSNLVSDFFVFCAKCESFTFELFDYKHYGIINTLKLQAIKDLDETRIRLEVIRAERALGSNVVNRIFNNFDLDIVLSALAYYSFVYPNESEYAKVRTLSRRLCKQEKIDFLICDIYMEHRKGNIEQIKETVGKLFEEENMQSNGMTIEGMFCLASALQWIGEVEAEDLVLSSRFKNRQIS